VIERARSRFRWFVARRERLLAALIAVAAGLAVFLIGTEIFPYHSSNHDEGVYLQQAELLLEGQLQLFPGGLADVVRPWFFVDAGDRLYPKYQPLPAALYAVTMAAFGEPRVTLAVVAACNAALVYTLGAMAFDRRIGLLAAVGFGFAPMTLVTSSVFLPYAPTTLFNLTFAVLYLRARRTESILTGVFAGGAIGVAFFMRPFTAFLFALPFVGHALVELVGTLRSEQSASPAGLPTPVGSAAFGRQAGTAVVGLGFVGLSLAYNAVITGDPFLFPYEAFAPLDGPGFGTREILNHSIEYTPGTALQANGYVLRYLLTRWVFGGVVGVALAIVGLVAGLQRWAELPGELLPRRLLAALAITVPLGNVLFWGNYNILSTWSDPADGLLGQFGPFYHFDLLAPAAIFGAAGAVTLWRMLRPRVRARVSSDAATRAVLAIVLAVAVLSLGGITAALVSQPLERNAAHTETYEEAYEPFETQEFEDAVVFLPTPYGDWLNIPFQYLRNDPGFDGPVVYAMDRDSGENFDVVDAYPERQHYRYTYRGDWTPDPSDRTVASKLESLSVRAGQRLAGRTSVGVPDRVTHATVRIETADDQLTHSVSSPEEALDLQWSLDSQGVTLDAVDGSSVEASTLDLAGQSEVVVLVRLSQGPTGTLSYRQAVSVRTTENGVEALWPPERTICPVSDDCGTEGTFIDSETRAGVFFDTRLDE